MPFPRFNASTIFSLAAITITLSSCGGDNDENLQSLAPAKTAIALNDAVSPEGCLSIPQYLSQLQALDPQLSLTTSTKSMDFSSKRGVRRNYELLTSFGGFEYSRGAVAKLQQKQNVSQQGCASFTVTDLNGTAQEFKIKENTREKISGQSENGEAISYRWLSPTLMEVSTRYISYDVPCGSELNPIYVEQVKVYDWGQASSETIPAGSPLLVDKDYLEKISEATGKNVSEFYSGDTQLVSQLMSIPDLQPRAELLACTRAPDEPPPPPDNGSDNGETPEDGSGDDANGGDTGGAEDGIPTPLT